MPGPESHVLREHRFNDLTDYGVSVFLWSLRFAFFGDISQTTHDRANQPCIMLNAVSFISERGCHGPVSVKAISVRRKVLQEEDCHKPKVSKLKRAT